MTMNKALKGLGAYKAYRYWKSADLSGRGQVYLLDRFGLERRNPAASLFGGIAFFSLGMLVGSGLGMMFAPMAGNDMRTTIREQGVKGVRDRTRPQQIPLPAGPSA